MHKYTIARTNQGLRQIQVCLPSKLKLRWCKHIGDDHPKTQYAYRVLAAVHIPGSTRKVFLACWERYQSAAKSKGEKHFHGDVFRRFCAAGFGRTTDDGSERRLKFVGRILTENHEPKPEVKRVRWRVRVSVRGCGRE